MSQITLTASMRSNLLNLQRTQALFDMTQERLSTGRRVNTALDNPASFFAAQSLNSRAAGLESLLDSMGQATQTLRAADESITTLTQMVSQAQALANTARDTANTHAVATGTTNLSRVGAPVIEAGIEAGDTFSIRIGQSDNITGTRSVNLTQTLSDVGFNTVPTTDGTGTVTNASLAIRIGDNAFVNVAVNSGMTIEALTKSINENTRLQGLVTASINDQGRFVLQSRDAKEAITIQAVGSIQGAHATAGPMAALDSGNAANLASALGLDLGYTVDIRAAGQARIAGVSVGLTVENTDTMEDLGISPTPASIRVQVGERSELLTFETDTTLGSAAAMIQSLSGIDTAIFVSATGVLTVTGEAGEAIMIQDVTGNFARTMGIQTADFIRPDTGGVDDLVNRINMLSTDIVASIDQNGFLRIVGTNGDDLIITDTMNAAGRIGGGAGNLGIEGLADNGVNVRRSYSEQFNQILTQIDMLVQNNDTGYRGVNLLNGEDLMVNFNAARTSNLLVRGAVLDANGLGMNESLNEWRGNVDIDRALADVDTAMARLSTRASEWGQNLNIITTREDFTSSMINTLVSGADKLTLADMNEEAANMLALQIRQQLGTNALALASQTQQSVLALF